MTQEPCGTAVDTHLLHNRHTLTLLVYIVPRWAGTGIRFYLTLDRARRVSRELTRAVKVLRDGLLQFAGDSQRGGTG